MLDQLAQPGNLDIDRAIEHVMLASAREHHELFPSQRLPWVLQEDAEQGEFPGRERNALSAPQQRSHREIKHVAAAGDVALDTRRTRGGPVAVAAQDRVDARDELARVEWFRDVIIRTHFKTDDPIDLLAFGREHDDRNGVAGAAQTPANGKAVLSRQHQVEYDEVRRVALQFLRKLSRIGEGRHLEALFREITLQQITQPDIVVHDQDFRRSWFSRHSASGSIKRSVSCLVAIILVTNCNGTVRCNVRLQFRRARLRRYGDNSIRVDQPALPILLQRSGRCISYVQPNLKKAQMKSNFLRTGIAIVSLFLLAAGANAALAHDAEHARAPQIENMLAALKNKLTLDTSQQTAWNTAFAQSLAAREAARSGHVRLRDAMQAELTKAEPDLPRIAALADDVQANTQAARRQARGEWLKLYATFAPDQKMVVRDLAKMRMERVARFAEHRRERHQQRGLGRPD